MIARLVIRDVLFMAVLAAILFAAAGTADWFGAWVFLAAMLGGGLVMTLWLAWRDRDLLNERLKAGRAKKPMPDRVLMPLLHLLFFGWVAFMAFDMRWHGTRQMPVWANAVAGAVMFAAFLATLRVFRENTFATAIIRVQPERGHKVIDTGPYALVRHPLYGIALVTYFAVPFTLGSWTGLAGFPLLALVVYLRALAEERMLKRELEGYGDYLDKVRYRFLPFVW